MNLYYEFTAACTSIVSQLSNGLLVCTLCSTATRAGTIIHGRNLDYGIPGLQNITLNLAFEQKGAVLYRCVLPWTVPLLTCLGV